MKFNKYKYAMSKEYGEYMNRPEVIAEVKRNVKAIAEFNAKREALREKHKSEFAKG